MTYRALTFYLVAASAVLGVLRLIERPQGVNGAAIAAALRARFLSEVTLLAVSFLIYFLWNWLLGDSIWAIASGIAIANAIGLVAWWYVRRLTMPPPSVPPVVA